MTEPFEMIRHLVSTPPPPPGFHMLVGPHKVQTLALCSLVRLLHAGRRVYWIDAGNRFDPLGLAQAARADQLDERQVLSQVQVARPFTAIQLTAMLSVKVPRIPPDCPIVVADPMGLFYDEEMPEDEVRRVFRDFIAVVKTLTAPILALAVQRECPPTRRGLSQRLLGEARAVAYYKPSLLLT